ncbi:T-complex protein 1 subunit alpha [Trichinella pseudospiralis]|uniref:T-complex protein 1 subunit alpha n=2 Tax=Trichinella pseudospiralis TaxID=6337 RepID=A0A0V1ILH9_TRIPS|nr:T-complex protein 1 subunit alpha [Trichinella pseudospiralis]
MSKLPARSAGEPRKINSELFSMTYGALVLQLLDDFDRDEDVNMHLDKIGYNIGLRIIDDFFSKNPNVGKCGDLKEVSEMVARGLKIYLGITATVSNWSPGMDEFSLLFETNPLAEFVELPSEDHKNLQYSQAICGALRGALEMVQLEVSATFLQDQLRSGNTNEIRVKLIRKLEEQNFSKSEIFSTMPISDNQSLLSVRGKRITGEAVRSHNVTAVKAVANILRSSLGPIGLDKIIVDDVGDLTITNDGATILKLLEVKHPAAKVMIELAQLQDKEVGDGTTSVVILAAEILNYADQLVKQRIHPTSIISGLRVACREAVKYMRDHLSINVDDLGRDCLLCVAKTAMSSKFISVESDFFANMLVDAIEKVKFQEGSSTKYPVNAVNVLKALGGRCLDSILINGYALNCTVASQSMPKQLMQAKIACLDFSLNAERLKMGITFELNDPRAIDPIIKEEKDIARRRAEKILKAGANVVLLTGGMADFVIEMFVSAGVMAVRRCKKMDLKRIAKATGATLITSMTGLETEESFDASLLGHAEEVVQERICDDELILIKGPKARTSSSIILRGANDFVLDEMERSVHDALCALKRVMESGKVVVGGGTVEAAISVYLENFANSLVRIIQYVTLFFWGLTISSRELLAVAEFASALMVIPRTLAVNSGEDCSDLIAKLRAYHNGYYMNRSDETAGLDVRNGEVIDNKVAGVLEPLESKVKILKFATEAAITILRIDDMIKVDPEERKDRRFQRVPTGYGPHGAKGPNCFDQIKVGLVMGGAVGAAVGVIFGGVSALSMGLRGRELLRQLGKVMATSSGSFGLFMAVGSALRC